MKSRPQTSKSPRFAEWPARGFSLTEVAIAIGIVAFVLVTLLGLMPTGLTAMREAMDQTLQTQILKKVTADALMTPFGELGTLASGSPYFYTRGGLLQDARDDMSHFQVTISQTNAVYPGSAMLSGLTNSVTTLLVQIDPIFGTTNAGKVYPIIIPYSEG